MKSRDHYNSFIEVELRRKVPRRDLELRYAQRCVLLAIASSRSLRERLTLKGGNALDFVHERSRSTKDLDTSLVGDVSVERLVKNSLRASLSRVEKTASASFRIQSVEKRPKSPGATRATWLIKIGFVFHDSRPGERAKFDRGESPRVVPLEISENDIVCEFQTFAIESVAIRVATCEDIVAEKLRALLQQVPRKRNREQDVFDIASILAENQVQLNPSKVADFLRQKCAIRDVEPSKAAFREEEVRERAEQAYSKLQNTVRNGWIEFDEAWSIVMGFVETLALEE